MWSWIGIPSLIFAHRIDPMFSILFHVQTVFQSQVLHFGLDWLLVIRCKLREGNTGRFPALCLGCKSGRSLHVRHLAPNKSSFQLSNIELLSASRLLHESSPNCALSHFHLGKKRNHALVITRCLPSGKRTSRTGKSQFLMGKSMIIFCSSWWL